MDLMPFFKSIIDQDDEPVVVCDVTHEIVYMNPAAAEHYSDDTGYGLIGRCVMDCHPHWANERIDKIVRWFEESADHNRVFTHHNDAANKDVYMIALRDGDGRLIGYYERHCSRNPDAGRTYGL